jgi:hypothetical protein
LHFAVVAPVDVAAIDHAAPQFTDLLSAAWDGESQRVTYTVDRESFSEPASALGDGTAHVFKAIVESGGSVGFYVDERLRWRSSLLLPLAGSELKGQLWLGGRASGDWGAFSNLKVALEEPGDRSVRPTGR